MSNIWNKRDCQGQSEKNAEGKGCEVNFQILNATKRLDNLIDI